MRSSIHFEYHVEYHIAFLPRSFLLIRFDIENSLFARCFGGAFRMHMLRTSFALFLV